MRIVTRRFNQKTLFRGRHSVTQHGLKTGGILQKRQVYLAGGAIALFGDDKFGTAFQLGLVRFVHFFAEDESHDVGILFDRSRLTQVCQLWTVIATTALRRAAQLGKRHYRNF